MTATLTQPTQLRVNSAASDFTTDSGARLSTPLYWDGSTLQRKSLLNAVRTAAQRPINTSVKSVSGITVDSFGTAQQEVEAKLGCTLDVLRSLLFQRGGLSLDLVLKIQLVTGEEIVSVKEIENAYKSKIAIVKQILKEG